ncbi:BspA family leucine-rich repeat surface protein [Bifidobacterium sp. ESL0800]|uniref:BspA family leucine-rich repeat surface protein n=1 Tax=Bifidobacterium sp. ESL0800 TaxID=2983236 RepID=UPI0023F92E92|nr:BspA family leucine-rich repeat surface protein [Bifidobacterium sp. ESL0800]WEV75107.1 BspA family leucine-rich repeat surface protein [Bifidobacterium sp. ESL0800]
MKSLNKAIIGMLAAAAMIAGSFATAASADETVEPQDVASQTDSSASSSVSSSQKGVVSPQQSTASGKSTSSDTHSEADAKASQPVAAPLAAQQPQAQANPDPSIKFQADWRNREKGSPEVHWYVQEIAPNQDVLHIGPGVLGDANSGSPMLVLQVNPDAKPLYEKIVRIVFDDAPNTHVVATSGNGACSGFPNVTRIDNVGDLDFSRLQGQTGKLDLSGFFDGDDSLPSVDLTGWGSGRTAPGAGLPGVSASSKWKTGVSIKMNDMFHYDPSLTTIVGLDNWDMSAVVDTSAMFRTPGFTDYEHSPLRDIGDLSRWDLGNVTESEYMFYGDSNLTDIGDLSHWNLREDTRAEFMFAYTGIVSFGNVSNWGMGSMRSMPGFFEGMRNLTELPGIGKWDVSKNTSFDAFFKDDASLTSLDLTGWHTDSARGAIHAIFRNNHALKEVKGLKDLNVSNVINIEEAFYGADNLTSLDLSGWDTRNVRYWSWAFSPHLSELKLGPDTKLDVSCFSYSDPLGGGATEKSGYTGRWTKGDNTWTSDAGDDDQSLATLTRSDEFGGGTYRWQEFAEVRFRKNAPKGAKITGKPMTIRKVGAYAEKIKITVPPVMFSAKDYTFVGWNTGKDGKQKQYAQGDVITGFKRGQSVRLAARWEKKPAPVAPVKPVEPVEPVHPTVPVGPALLHYTLRYESRPPAGLTATGSVPDDEFSIELASAGNFLHYNRTIAQNGYAVEGYTFVGWNTEEDLSGGTYPAGSIVKVAPGITTYYAEWQKDSAPVPAPSPTPTPSPTPAPAPSPNPSPSPTPEPMPTPSPEPSPAPSPSPTPTPGKDDGGHDGGTADNGSNDDDSADNSTQNNGIVPQAATLPAPAAVLPVPAPMARVAGNAGRTPVPAGSDNNATAPAAPQQRRRPTCVPANVYNRMQSGKRGTQPANWLESTDAPYAQNAAWSLSDYNGLPKCAIEASAPTAAVGVQFNFWWLLVFLVPLFLLLLASRNNGYILARHRDLDSVTISR